MNLYVEWSQQVAKGNKPECRIRTRLKVFDRDGTGTDDALVVVLEETILIGLIEKLKLALAEHQALAKLTNNFEAKP